jgi:poly(A) polymerase
MADPKRPARAAPPALAGAGFLGDRRLKRVLGVLNADGGEARVAGGAVRNALIGEAVTDIDIATTHTPDAVTALAQAAGLAVHPTGIDHGTVTVVAGVEGQERAFEVTTLRRDVETFGRKATVAYTDDWAEDARRRDFTINALYCDGRGRVFDPLGGYGDLERRRVRFVGDPQARIVEDYLRILRFFRFHATYGRGLPDRPGLQACMALKAGLAQLSGERIRTEFLKLLVAPGAVAAVKTMARHGILALILPGPANLKAFERMTAIDAAHGLLPDPLTRLLALCPVSADDLKERFRLSNAESRRLARIEAAAGVSPGFRDGERKIALYHAGSEAFADAVRLAWSRAPSGSKDAASDDAGWLGLIALAGTWAIPSFPVTGADLLARGFRSGPELGRVLRMLEDWWAASGFPPSKEAILARLSTLDEAAAT